MEPVGVRPRLFFFGAREAIKWYLALQEAKKGAAVDDAAFYDLWGWELLNGPLETRREAEAAELAQKRRGRS